jgi:hypothetical protein
MFELNFANLAAFALKTLINLTGETFEMACDPGLTPPVGGILLGTTGAIQSGVLVLRISTGTGPSLIDHFIGYWTTRGN